MENLMASTRFLAVFVVSGSVAFISVQAHKRLLSDFMTKIGFQFNGRCRRTKGTTKRVRFSDDVVEPSSDNKDYRRRYRDAGGGGVSDRRKGDRMRINREVLYKGIIQYRMVSKA